MTRRLLGDLVKRLRQCALWIATAEIIMTAVVFLDAVRTTRQKDSAGTMRQREPGKRPLQATTWQFRLK
jgi:hypothetical protein